MDDCSVRAMLDAECANTLSRLSEATAGSEEAKWQLNKLSEMHRMILRDDEVREKQTALERDLRMKREELDLKRQQILESRKDRTVKVVLEGVAVFVPLAVSSYWMAKGLEFETKGTFTSRTMEWISRHFRMFRR